MKMLALLLALLVPALARAEAPLRVGVTLHPYYAWVANVATGTDVQVIPILPGEIDAGNYQPNPKDIARLANLDALVINGLGHDDFVSQMVRASGNSRLVLINVNQGTPLLPGAHGEAANPHTFLSITNAIQQSYAIAAALGKLRPALAPRFEENAHAYARRLRALKAAALEKLAHAKTKRVVTVHDGYSYLLQELGLQLAGVVQPAHGLTPSAAELQQMIDLMKREHVDVVLTEESFPAPLLKTLQDATGARVYVISHIATGSYAPDEFEKVMQKNLDTLVEAVSR